MGETVHQRTVRRLRSSEAENEALRARIAELEQSAIALLWRLDEARAVADLDQKRIRKLELVNEGIYANLRGAE